MVWAKGHIIPGYAPSEWRRDDFGHLIRYSAYGDRTSPHGWEIDHIRPSALGGGEGIDNLRPLHCKKNASLGGLLATYLKG
jgi:hypothetical protein